MSDNIKLLEDRVSRAAERLRRLSGEREDLEREVQTLRDELATRPNPGQGAADHGQPPVATAEVVSVLREALAELRDDEHGVDGPD